LSGITSFIYDIDLSCGDDYAFHMSRLEALIQSFNDGTFPSYIDCEAVYGYGYLVKPFYSDFVLIPYGIIGYLVNVDFAYQFFLFSMTVLCAVFMYNLVYKLSKSSYSASISSLLYTFSLYRLFDVYCRAAIGEVLSFTFLPLVFLGLYYVVYGDFKKWYILAIGFSLVIMSHVISSVLLFFTVIIISLFYYKKFIEEPKRLYYLVLSGIVTLMITVYYLLPFLEQLLSDTFYFQESAFTPSMINYFRLDIIEILKSATDGFTNRVGVGPKLGFLLVFPLFLRFFLKRNTTNKELLKLLDILLIVGICYIFFTSKMMSYTIFPFTSLAFIQFPSRLFEFVAFFFSIVAGCCINLVFRSYKYKLMIAVFIFISLIIVVSKSADIYIERSRYIGRMDQARYIDKYEHLFFLGMEYYPVKLERSTIRQFITTRGDSVSAKYSAIINEFDRNKNITSFNVHTETENVLELPLIYYKGYTASLNGKELPVAESAHGLVQVAVDRSGRVEAYYKGTFVQKMGFCITILSIFALCVYIFLQKRRKV
jgi:hypothetical protein